MGDLKSRYFPLLGIYPKNPKTSIQKNVCTPMFTAVLFTIAKIWKQPKCPSIWEWIKKAVVHLHNRILPSSKKEETISLCDSMDGPGEYYNKWNEPVSETSAIGSHLYMESNKQNRNRHRYMEDWQLSRVMREGETRREKVKGLAKEVYWTGTIVWWCVPKEEGGCWVEVGKEGKSGENCNSINNKKEKQWN